MIRKSKRFPIKTAALGMSLALMMAALSPAALGATKVGNADDGSDLEGGEIIKSGPIIEARVKAVERLRNLHVEGIHGLGHLIAEVEKTEIYMAKRDVSAGNPEDQGAFHTDMRGLVFARTFAESNAVTRFFPIAEKLNEDQLIALHVHEGLHRALPEDIRENENVVSSITVAIAGPDGSHDRVRQVMSKYVSDEDRPGIVATGMGPASIMAATDKYPITKDASILKPSLLAYTYQAFEATPGIEYSKLKGMHVIQSFLYPFGKDHNPFGLGIEASILNRENDSQMGPLSLSGRMRLWSARGFDIGVWAIASLNTLSAEEVKSSPYGRDVYSFGLSARKDTHRFYIENLLGIALPSKTNQTMGLINYSYSYGGVVTASVRAGARFWKNFQVGGLGEFNLADFFRAHSTAFDFDSGRYYIVSAGPELSYRIDDVTLTLFGRFMLSSTKNVNYDYLGNIMGQGAGQRSLGASLAINL